MKYPHLIASLLVACVATAEVSFEVKNMEAHPRYPWNGKVDIDFTIESSSSTADFKVTTQCTDHIGNSNIVMRTVRYNDTGSAASIFTLKPGTHRLVWDADADIPNRRLGRVSFAVFANPTDKYLVIDLSGGPSASSYPVTTLTDIPEGGWTDEYKTTKLVMRRCSAGVDPLNRYTLTKDFYAGVFEVTQKQWELVMGESNLSYYNYGKGDTYPEYSVSYDKIRGRSLGREWPRSSAVDATSFIGKLRAKTGLSELDLPTEAQWEYACRAGTTTKYNTGDTESDLATAGWYSGNSSGKAHPVGQKTPNVWRLYDMHGNAWEWCLDWYDESLTGTDPVGAASGSYRQCRGGDWSASTECATSSYCGENSCMNTDRGGFSVGLRLFWTVP
ncbi:MAG: formylglycine-generating enzyme family protein [Kiritimatiellia bacterium]